VIQRLPRPGGSDIPTVFGFYWAAEMKDEALPRNEPVAAVDSDATIGPINDWLMEQALDLTSIESLFEGCCLRLRAGGIPLSRARLLFRTLHPLFSSVSLTWKRDEAEIGTFELRHGDSESSEEWSRSPFQYLIAHQLNALRRRLIGDDALRDFPVLDDFHAEGATDYLAYRISFGRDNYTTAGGTGIVGSWVTDRPIGFTDRDLRALTRIQSRMAVACKVVIKDQVARNIVGTYLGPDAGRQVLTGSIKRGDGETIHAVIWYNDLRDSTHLTESMPATEYLALLNSYFECTAGAVLAHQGEVLRFIGDAVLAIFPIRPDGMSEREACEKACAAATDAEARIDAINAERKAKGQPVVDFGLGLHVGDVMYGNIGVPERLEFSVIGPAANEVARLEDLSKELGRRIVVSGVFAKALALSWQSLGRHDMRGVGEPIEVFAPPR
jgi:adenylate cyclase